MADPGLSVLTGYYGVIILYLGLLQVKYYLFLLKKFIFSLIVLKPGRLDMIIGSRDNSNRILTMGSGGHFENCLW